MPAIPADLTPVVEVIERRLGMRCSGARADSIVDDVRRAMVAAGVDDPVVYARRLDRDRSLLDTIAETLRVGETYFLREADQLRVVTERVLPTLAADRTPQRPLQVWSAGCASGEEAYSIAITLETVGLAGRARILATDRSATALAAAERGVYGGWSLRTVDDSGRDTYFTSAADGTRSAVVDRLRTDITFRKHDLIADPYPTDQDVVVCRNVLLYLTPEHGAAVVARLAASLAPGGWLLLGSADPHHDAATLLEPVRTAAGVLYRRPEGRAGATGHRPATRKREPPAPAGCTCAASREDGDLPDALARCARALAQHPLDARLHGLHATLLLDAGQPARARGAATGALFLAPELAGVHLVLGRAHLALDEPASATRAFRNARTLLEALPADASVPPSSVPAGRLLEVAGAGEHQAARRSRR